jgi:hypothetical protein
LTVSSCEDAPVCADPVSEPPFPTVKDKSLKSWMTSFGLAWTSFRVMVMLPAAVVKSAAALTGPPPDVDPDGVTYVIDPAWAGVPMDATRIIARAIPAMMTIPFFERILMLAFSSGVARAVNPRGDHIAIPKGVAQALPILPAVPSSTVRFDRR